MRFRKRWLFLILAVLAALPGFPPLIQWGLELALQNQPYRLEWSRVSGYALTGLRLEDVQVTGPGVEARLDELRIGYNLIALLGKRLPLSLELRGGEVRVDPDALAAPAGGGGAGVQPLLTRLVLGDVRLESAAWPRFVLPPYRAEIEGALPRFRWQLATQDGALEGELLLLGGGDWETRFAGDVAVSRFWWQGEQYGRVHGRFGFRKGHWLGEAEIAEGGVTLAGFPVRNVEGTVRYRDHVITPELAGEALDGPVTARGVVNIPERNYRFEAEGTPRLEALLELWNVSLPARGSGPLAIEGGGWETLHLSGSFAGEGDFLERPLSYRGGFSFEEGFRLHAEAESSVLERSWQGVFDWQDGGYTAEVTDDKGSRVELSGEGVRYRGQGRLAWPRPLKGTASVVFSGEGVRWSARAESPDTRLLLARTPLDLSGQLAGEGMAVTGRLGPLAVEGRWDDLLLRLDPVPLVVGEVAGEGRWQERFSARLDYRSPYLELPLTVVQEGRRWLVRAGTYGEGVWEEGRFRAAVEALPLEALGGLELSGVAAWVPGKGWSGQQRLAGRYLSARSVLQGEQLQFEGLFDLPQGRLPFSGVAKADGVQGRLGGARFTLSPGQGRLEGRVELGPARYDGDLRWLAGAWSGRARVATPWLAADLKGEGALTVRLSGYVDAAGELWPRPRILGTLRLPAIAGVAFDPLPLDLDDRRLRLGEGEVTLAPPYPFALTLPWEGYGQRGRLRARGDLSTGALSLSTPWGEAEAQGPWAALALSGRFELPQLGELALGGRLDLAALDYEVRGRLVDVDAEVLVRGRGDDVRWEGRAQGERLRFRGRGRSGRLDARGFRSDALGLAGRWDGELAYDDGWAGDLTFAGPSGRWRAHGYGTLQLEGAGPGYRAEGYFDERKLFLRARVDRAPALGEITVQGPWRELEARGEGVWRLAGLGERSWTFSGSLPERRWYLGGPLRVHGEGLRYRGAVAWTSRVGGRALALRGGFDGDGLRVEGQGTLAIEDYRVSWRVRHDEEWSAHAEAPVGEAGLDGGRLWVRGWDMAPLGRALDLPLAGRLGGAIELSSGAGSLGGNLAYADYRLGLLLRKPDGWSFTAFDPERRAGLRYRGGTQPRLEGVGEVRGRIDLAGEPWGRLEVELEDLRAQATAAAGQVRFDLERGPWAARGSWREPQLDVELDGPVRGRLELDTASLSYRGRLRYASKSADVLLAYHGQKGEWSAQGYAVGYTGVPQAGPLLAEGEGGTWRVFWAAPLQLELTGEGARLLGARLSGTAHTGSLTRELGRLRADLQLNAGRFTGSARWSYGDAFVEAVGAGDRLNLRGEGAGLQLTGSAGADGALDVELLGEGRLARARWSLSAQAGGRWLRPRVVARMRAVGSDEATLQAELSYDRVWSVRADGPGLRLRAGPERVEIASEGLDLRPFLGVPLRLYARAQAPAAALVLPFRAEGPQTELAGRWDVPRGALELAGTLFGGEVQGDWRRGEGALRLDLPSPRVVGEVRRRAGRWSGGFDIDVPLEGGGLRGRLDAAAQRLQLFGYGTYSGELRAELRPGRLEGSLAAPAALLSADLLQIGEGWVGRLRLESERWGGVLAVGEGDRFQLSGLGALAPLEGELKMRPWSLAWSYAGPLPEPLGALEAGGTWPAGAWLEGRWTFQGQRIGLEGRGAELRLAGEGLSARLGAGGLEARLAGFRLGGVALAGEIQGPLDALALDLKGGGLRLEGQLGSEVRLDVSGWAAGRLVRSRGAWSGTLEVPGGRLTVGGSAAWPRLEGVWRGAELTLDYPQLALGGLRVDLAERRSEGRVLLDGVSVEGAGEALRLNYPMRGGALQAEVRLQDGRSRLFPDGLGDGLLVFEPGEGFSGTLVLQAPFPGETILRGQGEALDVRWFHPATDWLPWEKGKLEAELGLSGRWSAVYRADGAEVRAEGRGGEASVVVDSRWGGGAMRYAGSWEGRVQLAHWPLPPLDAELELDWTSEAGALALVGELMGEAGRMSFNLRADADRWVPQVETAAVVAEGVRLQSLPELLQRLPYASGRVDATLSYARGLWTGRLVSDAVTVGEETHALELALYSGEDLQTLELTLDESRIEAELSAGRLLLRGELAGLPLHFLTGAWAGPPPGTALWTGAFRASVPLQDPADAYAVLVGERLVFEGDGRRLQGRAAVRYEGRTLYLDELDLTGDGRIHGEGFWGAQDADLKLTVEDTLMTPILGVVPQWRPYRPHAEGSLKLRALGRTARFEAEELSFGIASVEGQARWLEIAREGGRLRVGGAGELTAPYPARWVISGEGPERGLALDLEGEVELPLVGRLQDVRGRVELPGTQVDLRAGGARVEGRLWPLVLRLSGELPVSYPEYYLQSGQVKPNLLLVYQDGRFVLSGETEVVRAVLSRPEGKREVAFRERRYRYPLRFDKVRFFSKGGLLIREPLAQGEAEGEVYLGGELADPFLSGEVRGLRGEFLLGQHRFQVDQAWARFSPVAGLYPEIYLRAHSRLRSPEGEIELYLESQGRFLREEGSARLVLEPRLWAEADGQILPYGQEELLSLLALGGRTTVAEGVASLAVQNLLISQLEYELARALGLDVFTVRTELFTGGEAGTTQFTVGKYLSPDLFVSYSLDLGGRQVIGAEYRIDGLRLRVESELGGETLEPQVRFSMLYALRRDLDLILKLSTGRLHLGLEWRF